MQPFAKIGLEADAVLISALMLCPIPDLGRHSVEWKRVASDHRRLQPVLVAVKRCFSHPIAIMARDQWIRPTGSHRLIRIPVTTITITTIIITEEEVVVAASIPDQTATEVVVVV